jgi:DNA-binding transcriptional MerR regulator
MNALRTSDVAKEGGVNLETVRYYERRGLLPKPPRTPAGYRTFGTDAVRRLRFIKRAQDLGFSLKEIKELLALRVDARTGLRTPSRARKANGKRSSSPGSMQPRRRSRSAGRRRRGSSNALTAPPTAGASRWTSRGWSRSRSCGASCSGSPSW